MPADVGGEKGGSNLAYMEQLICNLTRGTRPGAALVARSAGLTRELATEVMTAITGWDPRLEGEPGQAVLQSIPLKGVLPGIPGRLYLVSRARLGDDRHVLVHGLILSEGDYGAYGLNPYRIQAEGLLPASWAPGMILERIERRPSSFAALVSPLPNEEDAQLLDEALRQYFSTGRLIIALADPDEAAERFFALFLESIPTHLRRELRFASYAPAGQSEVAVGAACMPEGSFQAWRGTLRAAGRRSLPPDMEDYVATVRRHVAAGDLMSLTAAGGDFLHASGRREPPQKPAAAPSADAAHAPQPPPAVPAQERSVPRPRRGGCPEEFVVPQRARAVANSARARGERGQASRGFWLVLVVVVAAGGGAALLTSRQEPVSWTPWARTGDQAASPGGTPAPVRPALAGTSAEMGGVIDVGALYESELEVFRRQTAAPATEGQRLQAGVRARDALLERGADALRRQAQEHLAEAGRDVDPAATPQDEAQRARALAAKGRDVARELRRLTLATHAFNSGEPWDDLSSLDATRVRARWDSVRRRSPRLLADCERRLEICGLTARMDTVGRQTAARARLASLLGQARRDKGWLPGLRQATAELEAVSLPPALSAWRGVAARLAALKSAEDETDFGAQACLPGWEDGAGISAAVPAAVESLRVALAAPDRGAELGLARAVMDLHDNLGRARDLAAGEASNDELVRLFAALDASVALTFDPAVYADHVERARMAALAALLASARAPGVLPLALFPRADRQAALDFLELERQGAAGVAWNRLADTTPVPFLARWARARARSPDPAPPRFRPRFESDFQRLTAAAAALAAEAQRGRDWTTDVIELRVRVDSFLAHYPDRPSLTGAQIERKARARALAQALDAPLRVPLSGVTVTLEASQLRMPAEIVVELIVAGGDDSFRSPAVLLTRDATGNWSGTCALAGEIALRPAHPLEARINRVADGRTLAVARYGRQGALDAPPGGLLRARPAAEPEGEALVGSVAFEIPGWFWRRLAVPDLRQPLAARQSADSRAASGRSRMEDGTLTRQSAAASSSWSPKP